MMNSGLKAWTQLANKRNAARKSLYGMVFGSGSISYFVYRTKLQFVNTAIRLVLHVLEYFLIFHTIPHFLMTMIFLRLFIIAIESGWWGLLDSMRQRIRFLYDKNDREEITKEIQTWFDISKKLACAVVLLALIAAITFSKDLNQLFIIVILGVYLATRIVLRTLYSGAYAVQRVYMKFEWLVICDLLVFCLAWSLKPWLGEWTITFCLLIAFILSTLISYHFISGALDFIKVRPDFLANLSTNHHAQIIKNHNYKELYMPCLAMAFLRMHDVLLIVAMYFAHVNGVGSRELMIAFYLVVPAIRAAMNWAQIMHFDMIKEQMDAFDRLRSFFYFRGLSYSLIYGFLVAFLVLLLTVLTGFYHTDTVYLIPCYVIGLSVLGFMQVNCYSNRLFGRLIMATTLQYSLLFLLIYLSYPLEITFLISTIIPLIYLHTKSLETRYYGGDSELRFLSWLRVNQNPATPCSLLIVRFLPNTGILTKRAIVESFLSKSGELGSIQHTFYKDFLLIVKRGADLNSGYEKDKIIRSGAGNIVSFEHVLINNQSDLEKYLQKFCDVKIRVDDESIRRLEVAFGRIFPNGIVQFPTQYTEKCKNLSQQDMFSAALDALAYSEGRKKNSNSEWYVTAIQCLGYVKAIFMAPKMSVTDAQRKEWANEIRSL